MTKGDLARAKVSLDYCLLFPFDRLPSRTTNDSAKGHASLFDPWRLSSLLALSPLGT